MNTLKIKSVVITAVAAIMLLMVSNVSNAQNQNRKNSRNMRLANIEFILGNIDQTCYYLEQELEKRPRNGYAYLYLGYLVINDADLFEMTGYDITFPIECFDRAIEYLPMRDMEAIASASCYRKICYEYFNSSLKNVINNTEEVFY